MDVSGVEEGGWWMGDGFEIQEEKVPRRSLGENTETYD